MQSRLASAIESCVNVFSGMVLAIMITQIYSWLHPTVEIPIVDNIALSVILTIVSVARSYTWRRYFNRRDTE